MKVTLFHGVMNKVKKNSDGFAMLWALTFVCVLSFMLTCVLWLTNMKRLAVEKQSVSFYQNLETENKKIESEWIYAVE